jgi:hypothetical protein
LWRYWLGPAAGATPSKGMVRGARAAQATLAQEAAPRAWAAQAEALAAHQGPARAARAPEHLGLARAACRGWRGGRLGGG